MLKRQSSCPERDVRAERQKDRKKDAGFQARKAISQCIEEATLVFEKRLVEYWTIQQELDMKFQDLGKNLSNENYFNLLAVLELEARTSDSAAKIVWALERLARLSYFIE